MASNDTAATISTTDSTRGTPPPPSIQSFAVANNMTNEFRENAVRSGISTITPEKMVEYENNFKELKSALSRLDIVLAAGNPDQAQDEVARLLNQIAGIDLPQEIKNTELGRHSTQTQSEVKAALKNNGSAENRAVQAAQTSIHNIALAERMNEEYLRSLGIDLNTCTPATRDYFMGMMKSDQAREKSFDEFLNGPYSEEARKKFEEEQKQLREEDQKRFENWQKQHFANWNKLSAEEQEKRLTEARAVAEDNKRRAAESHKRAEELRRQAENETDPERKKQLLDAAAEYDKNAAYHEQRVEDLENIMANNTQNTAITRNNNSTENATTTKEKEAKKLAEHSTEQKELSDGQLDQTTLNNNDNINNTLTALASLRSINTEQLDTQTNGSMLATNQPRPEALAIHGMQSFENAPTTQPTEQEMPQSFSAMMAANSFDGLPIAPALNNTSSTAQQDGLATNHSTVSAPRIEPTNPMQNGEQTEPQSNVLGALGIAAAKRINPEQENNPTTPTTDPVLLAGIGSGARFNS